MHVVHSFVSHGRDLNTCFTFSPSSAHGHTTCSVADDRIIDTAISELGFTSTSMGLSACGVRAVADTMTMDFMLEATSTLVEQAAKLRCVQDYCSSVCMIILTAHIKKVLEFAGNMSRKHL